MESQVASLAITIQAWKNLRALVVENLVICQIVVNRIGHRCWSLSRSFRHRRCDVICVFLVFVTRFKGRKLSWVVYKGATRGEKIRLDSRYYIYSPYFGGVLWKKQDCHKLKNTQLPHADYTIHAVKNWQLNAFSTTFQMAMIGEFWYICGIFMEQEFWHSGKIAKNVENTLAQQVRNNANQYIYY